MVISSSPEVGGDVGHGDRVGHVGLAGAAQLTLVGVDGRDPGSADQLDVTVLVVLEESPDQTLDRAQQDRVGRASAK